MSIGLTIGRSRQSRDIQGGFSVVYLTAFESYLRSQIITNGQKLVSFPGSFIYKFNVLNATFTEEQSEENGGKFYTQNLTFNLAKINKESNNELLKIIKKDYRAVVKDNNGKFRILGLYTGLTSDMTTTTGGGKADFNGYKIDITATEINSALFIDDLDDAGFIDPSEKANYIFQDENNYIFQDGNNYIFN